MTTTQAGEAARTDRAAAREGELTRYLVPVGRLFYSLIFLQAPLMLFSKQGIGYAAQQGVPMAGVLVPLAGLLALAGGLSVLLGYRARIGAGLLVLFLVPVTLKMHAFWAASDPMTAQMQLIHFMKNLCLLGMALVIAHVGSGPVSLDERAGARVGRAG